jgi:predicted nucleic acid-binding protein
VLEALTLRFVPRSRGSVMKKIADSGLLIAALDKTDGFHSWAANLLEDKPPPWLVCEPVLAEVCASLGTSEPLLEMLQVGDLEIQFSLEQNLAEVLALTRKYRDQRMDLADACVVRMSELLRGSVVFTVDPTDFSVYRRNSRQPIPCVFPS